MWAAYKSYGSWLEHLPAWQRLPHVFIVIAIFMTGLQLLSGATVGNAIVAGVICGVAVVGIAQIARTIRDRRTADR